MQKPPACSIIIPVLNEAKIVQQQLQCLQALRCRGWELILVDGGSTDQTISLAKPLVDRVLQGHRGRSAQMNAGAAQASHDLLVFLHIDTQLPQSIEQQLEQFDRGARVWAFFPVRLDAGGLAYQLIAWFMNGRSRLTRVCTGDQTLCVKSAAFKHLQGFADIALMEDVEICKRLRKLSAPYCFTAPVLVSARKWQRGGLWRTVILMWRLRLAYFFGADPEQLHKQYYDSQIL